MEQDGGLFLRAVFVPGGTSPARAGEVVASTASEAALLVADQLLL
jgi:hypothetical protein